MEINLVQQAFKNKVFFKNLSRDNEITLTNINSLVHKNISDKNFTNEEVFDITDKMLDKVRKKNDIKKQNIEKLSKEIEEIRKQKKIAMEQIEKKLKDEENLIKAKEAKEQEKLKNSRIKNPSCSAQNLNLISSSNINLSSAQISVAPNSNDLNQCQTRITSNNENSNNLRIDTNQIQTIQNNLLTQSSNEITTTLISNKVNQLPVLNSLRPSLIAKLLEASNSYFNNRSLLEEISKNNSTNMIYKHINETIGKLLIKEDLNISIIAIENMLNSLKSSNNIEHYCYAIDTIFKILFMKSTNLINENKEIFKYYSLFIKHFSDKNSFFEDWFIQISVYTCPFLIPKIFTKTECNNNTEIYRKRYGFKNNDQTIQEFLENKSSNAYLFFSYVKFSKKFVYSDNFIQSIFNEKVILDYPVIAVFIVFCDVFCDLIETLKIKDQVLKIAERMNKKLEDLKNTPAIKTMRSILNLYINNLKKFVQIINEKSMSDFCKQTINK